MGPMGAPWAPWGPHGAHGGPHGPMGPHGGPWLMMIKLFWHLPMCHLWIHWLHPPYNNEHELL